MPRFVVKVSRVRQITEHAHIIAAGASEEDARDDALNDYSIPPMLWTVDKDETIEEDAAVESQVVRERVAAE